MLSVGGFNVFGGEESLYREETCSIGVIMAALDWELSVTSRATRKSRRKLDAEAGAKALMDRSSRRSPWLFR